MKDPTRLLESGTELEASLLGSAEDDAPREGLDRRVHAAIGIGGIAISASTASATAAAASHAVPAAPVLISHALVSLGVVKWAGIIVLGTGMAVGAAAVVHREASVTRASRAGEPSVSALAPVTRGRATPPVSVADIPPPVIPAAPAAEPASSLPVASEPVRAKLLAPVYAPSEAVAAPPSPGPKTPALEDEVALLNRAHEALESGDATLALTTLDRHDLDYMHGALAPEALEVRIEAYVKRHDDVKVAELGQTFLARYPGHPLAGKVRSLLEKSVRP
jgi:hypothetical protein